jgi:hypothetical protein
VEQKAEPSTWDQTKEMTRKEWTPPRKNGRSKSEVERLQPQSRKEKLRSAQELELHRRYMTKT